MRLGLIPGTDLAATTRARWEIRWKSASAATRWCCGPPRPPALQLDPHDPHRPGRQSQQREDHAVQRSDRHPPAGRQLARASPWRRRPAVPATATSRWTWWICRAPTRWKPWATRSTSDRQGLHLGDATPSTCWSTWSTPRASPAASISPPSCSTPAPVVVALNMMDVADRTACTSTPSTCAGARLPVVPIVASAVRASAR